MINTSTSVKRYEDIANVLGKKYLKGKIERPLDYIKIAEKGINANVINNFRTYFELPLDETSVILNISQPTIYRWLRENKILERNTAVKLLQLTELFLYGVEVFGNHENFIFWLQDRNIAMGNVKPIELLDLPDGISMVRDELGRIEYGVLA